MLLLCCVRSLPPHPLRRLQDQTTSSLLPFPALPPAHPDCLPQSITAVQPLQGIHTLLLHSTTRELSSNLILGWPPAAAVAALLPLGNNVQPSIRWLWTESQKFSSSATPFLLSYSRCTWHTHVTCFVSNSYEALCVKSSHLPASYRICLTYTYIYMTLETRRFLVWFLEIRFIIIIIILKKA